jgi:protein ImuB
MLSNPHSPIPNPLYACLYRPPSSDAAAVGTATLIAIAQAFSPRYERHRDDLVSIDISGLTRMLGSAQAIGEELRREAAARGVRAHVAVARTRMAALLIVQARPGLTVIAPGEEAAALALLSLALIAKVEVGSEKLEGKLQSSEFQLQTSDFILRTSKRWGLKTLGEVASLPTADLVSRLGRGAAAWQAIARGEDIRPLVPMLEDERFEASLDLEWPIADLEPLSFVLTRLLEPLSTRLERRDRGAAVLHILLRLVTRETTSRRLELPTPMREVRALRTLALLDLEAHPVEAAIDRVTIVIDPTPGRVVQHTLYTRAQPTPEQLSTLLARLGALMGADRFGAPVSVDTERPGAFAMAAFSTEHPHRFAEADPRVFVGADPRVRPGPTHGSVPTDGTAVARREPSAIDHQPSAMSHQPLMSALRRCRQPVPARVAVVDGRPVRVTTDRRGFTGGAVTHCAGPWRTSGNWWEQGPGAAGQAGRAGQAGMESPVQPPIPPLQPIPPILPSWDRDEWDVSLNDGAVYRVFRDRGADRWFVDAIVD